MSNPKKLKIYNLDDLKNVVTGLKKKKKKIIHCHGVFDLIHIGHIKYFEEAKTKADILIVTLTQDKYVNKGPHRPVFGEDMRAESLAALEAIDYVAINKWPTAIDTIALLKPDIYFKGADYKDLSADITGNIKKEKDAVTKAKGTLQFSSTPMYSSSNLLNEHFSQLSEEQKTYIDKIKKKYKPEVIKAYMDKLQNFKVMLIGEIIIDEYIFCNTLGKSGKDPLLMTHQKSVEQYAGGSIAVANHMSDFVKTIDLVSYIGEKAEFLDFIKSNIKPNVKLKLTRKKGATTILKKRYIEIYNKSKLFGVYDFNDDYINEKEETKLLNLLKKTLKTYDSVIVADYGHGLITPAMIEVLKKSSPFLTVNTQVNAANIGFHTISHYKAANYVCIHEGELRHAYRNRTEDVKKLARKLLKDKGCDFVVITRGKFGALALDNKNKFIECPAFAGKIVDRIGAGDTFMALSALCISAGIPLELSLLLANLAGAFAVSKMGTGDILNRISLLKTVDTLLK
jgi:rfaE bifunctional protein kinase chain/domain/rfaE bifunctional protein nucleotidyltransferase chain/domain